ncbi:hypothetical protein ACS0TY_000787 [Phlomoides rotata]
MLVRTEEEASLADVVDGGRECVGEEETGLSIFVFVKTFASPRSFLCNHLDLTWSRHLRLQMLVQRSRALRAVYSAPNKKLFSPFLNGLSHMISYVSSESRYAPNASYVEELVEDVHLLIRRAERCLEAGADMIMIDADDFGNRPMLRYR